SEMGFIQPRPHRALDDADATRQLLLRLRDEAVGLHESLKESMVALVAPYEWPVARFFAEALTAPNPNPQPEIAVSVESAGRGRSAVAPPEDPYVLAGLREWLPWDFKACLLKGRSNYVSLRRWRRYLSEPCKDAEELMFKLKVLIWLHTTESGDRSELRLHGREEVLWNRIASDPLDCVGIHCTKEDCYVHRARAEAETADLVVINHALLLADVEVGGGLLPEFDHLVIDEAHHLEEAATRG